MWGCSRGRPPFLTLLVFSFSLLGAGIAEGASTRTWTGGGGDNNWMTAGNWGGTAPVAGDNLVFAGNTQPSTNNNFPANTSFGTITFDATAGSFTLGGSAITLGGNVTNNSANLQIIDLAMSMAATRTFNTASGNIALGGVLSGAGGLTKSGTEVLLLSNANTYAGTTTIGAGTLRLSANDVLPDGAGKGNVTVTGVLDVSGFSDTINGFSGTGTVDNTTGVGTYTLTVGGNNQSSTFSGVIQNTSGSLALTKIGTGTLTLSGAAANTHTGLTTVSAGRLTLNKTAGVDAIAGDLDITGAQVTFSANHQIADTSAVSMSGATSILNGTSVNGGQLNTLVETIGSLNMTGGCFNSGSSAQWTITGTFSCTGGNSTIVVGNSGTQVSAGGLTLTAMTATTGGTVNTADSFTLYGSSTTAKSLLSVGAGGLTLNGSRLNLRRGGSGSQGCRLVLDGDITTTGVSASVIMEDTSGGSTGARDVELSSTAGAVTRTVTTGAGGADLTISVPITNGASAAAAVTKAGPGTLTLSGTTTYTGATTVDTGTLLVIGSTSATSAVTVNNTGTLGGTGTIGGTITLANGATLAPGAGGTNIGTLNSGIVTMDAGSTYSVDLDGATPTFDQTHSINAVVCAGTLTLASISNSTSGRTYTIVDADGGVFGTFNGLADGAVFSQAGQSFQIAYTPTQVTLTRLATTRIWDGGGADDNWTTAANWDSDTAPVEGDDLIFAGTTRLTPVNNFAGGASFGSITFSSTAGAFAFSGNAVSLNGDLINSSTNLQTVGLGLILPVTRTVNCASGDITLSGALTGSGGLSKTGAGNLTLSGLDALAVNNYSGTTIVNGGTILITTDAAFTGGLTFGASAGSTNLSTLDLSSASVTFDGLMLVQTDSASANSLLIGNGHTLTLANGLTLGINSSAATTTKLTVTGAGDMAITGGNVQVGVSQSTVNSSNNSVGTLDLSGLTGPAGFSANVTNFNVGQGNTSGGFVTLTNTANAILATTMNIGNSNGNNGIGTNSVILGTGTNVIQANTINIGFSKISGTLSFASQAPASPGTVTITDKAGTGAANIYLGNNNSTDTAAVFTGLMDLRGHVSTVTAGTLQLGICNNSNTGSTTGTLLFDTGTFTVNAVTLAAKSKSGGTGVATANLTVSGGTFTVNTSIATASNTAATGSAVSNITITGGTMTINANLTKTGGTNTTSNLTLNGGTLAMTSHTVGSAAHSVAFNLQSGTLTALAELNDGGALTKSTSGTATLTGANTYSGATTVEAGTLLVDGSTAAASTVTVNNTATLGGTGTVNGAITMGAGGTLAPGAVGTSVGTLNTADVTMDGASVYRVDLDGNNLTAEQTNSSGTVTCAGTLRVGSIINPGLGKTYTIVTSGTLLGNFYGLGNGDLFSDQGHTFQIAYNLDNTVTLEEVAHSTTRVWDGEGGDNNWSTALNWDSDVAPVAGDDLVFAGTTRLAPNNNYAVDTRFASITFNNTAGAFTIAGNRIALTGNVANDDDDPQTLNLPMVMDTTSTFDAAAGNMAVGGILSGTGGLTKTGAGTLTLTSTNTYTGVTTVSAGTLQIGNGITNGSIATSVGIVDNATLNFNVTGTQSCNQTITGTGNLVKSGAGTLTLTGINTYAGSTVISAGTLTNGNTLAPGLDIRAWKNGSNQGDIDGARFDLANPNPAPNDSTYTSTIGYATQSINMSNLDQEHFGAGTNSGVPDASVRPTGYQSTYTVEYRGRISIPTTGTYAFATGSDDGSAIWIDPVSDNPDYTTALVKNSNFQSLTTTGSSPIALTAGLHKIIIRYYEGTGQNVLQVLWDPAGGTSWSAIPGNLFYREDAIGNLPATTDLFIASGGVLNLNGTIQTIASLSDFGGGGGSVTNQGGIGTSLIIDGSSTTSFSGVIRNGSQVVSLVKRGSGTQTLSGGNIYTGSTAITAGTLLVTGSTAAGSAVTVSSTGTLGGTGTVSGTITMAGGGTLAPGLGGTSIGTLNAAAVTMNGGSTFSVDLNGTVPTFDRLNSTGTVTCAGTLTIASLVNEADGKVYPIVTASNVTGTFSGLPNGVVFLQQSRYFQITYTNTQVTLTQLPHTNPRTWVGGGTDNNWTTAANWNLNQVPAVGDDLIFAGTTRLSPNNDFAGDVSFNSITFNNTAGAFTLGGNRIVLTGDITNSDADLQTLNLAMILNATPTCSAASGDIAIGGVMSGPGGLTKSGAGTLTLTNTHTYAGVTTVSAGTLQIGNGTSDGALSASAGIVNNAALIFNIPGTVSCATVISGTGGLTKTGAGSLTLSVPNTYAGATIVQNGTLRLFGAMPGLYEGLLSGNWNTSGAIPQTSVQLSARWGTSNTSGGNNVYPAWGYNSTWGYTGYFRNPSSQNVLYTFGKNFDDSALIKIDGTTVLSHTTWNSYPTATATIGPGWHTLELRFGQGTGGVGPIADLYNRYGLSFSTDGGTTWSAFADPGDGSLLAADFGAGNILPVTTDLSIAATGTLDLGGTNQEVASLTDFGGGGGQIVSNYAGVPSALTVNLAAGTSTFTGVIANGNSSVSLVKSGNGTQVLSGASTYSGATTINGGILRAGIASVANTSGAFGNRSAVTLADAAGAILDLVGFNTQIGSLTGGGTTGGNVTLGAGTLTIGSDDTSPAAYAGVISGTGGLTKVGTGILTLGGTSPNTYTGPTTVNAGSLLVTGSTDPSSAVTVNSGGILGGTGTVGGTVSIANGGYLAPGAGGTNIGILTTAAVTLSASSFFSLDLNGSVPTFEQVNSLDTFACNGQLIIASTANMTNGQDFTIVSTANGVSGQFSGLANGAQFTSGGRTFQITYNPTTVTLTDIVHSNPRTWTGGGADDNWTTADNWDSSILPVIGDDLIFAGTTRLAPNNDFPIDSRFNSITFADGADAFVIDGNRITLDAGITNHDDSLQTVALDVIMPETASTLWRPDQMPTLTAWYDADEASTITETAGLVSQWNDKSGNGNHATQGTDADRPQTGVNTVNARNVLTFNDQYLAMTSEETSIRSLFVVADGLNGCSVDSQVAPITGAQASSTDYQFIRTNATDYSVSIDGGVSRSGHASANGGTVVAGTNINLAMSAAAKANPNLWYMDWDAATRHKYIGRFNTSSDYQLAGRLGELIFLNAVPSVADRQRLEGYLAHKWGMTANLPATHPYKATVAQILTTNNAPIVNAAVGDVALTGVVSGGGGLIKSGAGTLTLSNANTYSGITTINDGTLRVTGQSSPDSGTGSGSVAVNAGGSLSGNGRVAGAVTVATNAASSLYPNSNSTLTLGSNLTFNTNDTAQFDLSNNAAGTNDKIVLENQTLTCAGSVTINSAGVLDTATYVLFDVGVGGTINGYFNLTPIWSGATPANASDYNVLTIGTKVVLNCGPIPITVTAGANTKVYDGTTAAATLPTITLGMLDPANTATWFETYDTKHVGVGKTLTPAGTVRDGSNNDVTSRYAITFVPVSTGVITVRPLIVTATGIDKVYDGTTTATVDLHGNHIGGDAILLNYSDANFDTPDIGAGKPVAVDGIWISGADASNYDLQNTTTTTTATIYQPAVTILVQPVSLTRNIYDLATFSVSVVGAQPMTFQWRRNGVNIPGATGISYTTPPVTGADNGAVYSVVISNAYGSAISTGATLTVNTVGDGLTMTRYANPDFTGASLIQVVPNVNVSGVPNVTSTRWTGSLLPVSAGTYHFYARTTGPVRLWLDDVLVINAWSVASDTTSVGAIVLQTGRRYTFRMDFVNVANPGLAKLDWGLPGWGPVPGGPPGDHVIIPQSNFFTAAPIGVTSAPNAKPRTTNPEEGAPVNGDPGSQTGPQPPPTEPPGELPLPPDPQLPVEPETGPAAVTPETGAQPGTLFPPLSLQPADPRTPVTTQPWEPVTDPNNGPALPESRAERSTNPDRQALRSSNQPSEPRTSSRTPAQNPRPDRRTTGLRDQDDPESFGRSPDVLVPPAGADTVSDWPSDLRIPFRAEPEHAVLAPATVPVSTETEAGLSLRAGSPRSMKTPLADVVSPIPAQVAPLPTTTAFDSSIHEARPIPATVPVFTLGWLEVSLLSLALLLAAWLVHARIASHRT